MKKRRKHLVLILVTSLATLGSLPNSMAATKVPTPVITATPLKPALITNFSGGDDVSSILTTGGLTPTIYLIGTVESSTSPLLTTQSLGASDGYLVALDAKAQRLWDLHLGTSGDDVATSAMVDASGNLWIAGASALTNSTPAPGFNQVNVWEVSITGALLNTYSLPTPEVDIPTSIAQTKTGLALSGKSSKVNSSNFSITLTPTGVFGKIKYFNQSATPSSALLTVNSSSYAWQSYVTSSSIQGVRGIAPNVATTVLIDSTLKTRSLKNVFTLTGKPISLLYQPGLGVIALTSDTSTYYLTIVHTK